MIKELIVGLVYIILITVIAYPISNYLADIMVLIMAPSIILLGFLVFLLELELLTGFIKDLTFKNNKNIMEVFNMYKNCVQFLNCWKTFGGF